jgi:hypothetical protein
VEVTASYLKLGAITDEYREARQSFMKDGTNTKVVELITTGQHSKPIVMIGRGEGGGGMVDVFNLFGNRVASVQAAKNNAGMVGVNKLSGEPSKVLSAD